MSVRYPSLEPINDRPVRFAIVGLGRISQQHIQAISACPKAELVGACDIDHYALMRLSTSYHGDLTVRHELDRLLDDIEGQADVVVLTTPSGLHAAQAIKCASRGFHVITEKPMATRWSDAVNMVRAFDQAQKLLMVVKQNRLNPTLVMVKRLLDEGRLGRIYAVQSNVFWTRPQLYYDLADWRGTWEFDGGAVMNQASHYVDLLTWLFGPVVSVSAYASTLARKIEVEDTATLSLEWQSGALGSMMITMLTYRENLEGSLTIIGERGTIRLGGKACNTVDFLDIEGLDAEEVARLSATSYDTSSVYGYGHKGYYQNVVNALEAGTRPDVDGRDGLKSLEVIMAAYRSSRLGCRVHLPFDLGVGHEGF